MALLLNEAEVARIANMNMALEAVEEVFQGFGAGDVQSRPRQRVQVPGGVLNTLNGAVPSSGVIGLKTYSSYAAAGTRFLVLLFGSENGDLLAMIEADRLGQLRTGAATGIGTRYLAREDASIVGQIGAGWQARTQIEAVCAVRPIKEVRVYSRDQERREGYCRDMGQRLGVEMAPVDEARAAVAGADILITITSARAPVLLGEWLEPGQHVNAAGSNWAQKQELDVQAVSRADVIAADTVEQAQIEAGDLIAAVNEGAVSWDQVLDLGDIVAKKRPGRASAQQITLFESQGLGVQDLAMAVRVYKAAREQGLGREVEMLSRTTRQR